MRILFFAQLKQLTGQSEVDWPEATPMTEDELWQRLEQVWPALITHRRSTRLARNAEFALPGTVFQPGDEVALIPPVSGG